MLTEQEPGNIIAHFDKTVTLLRSAVKFAIQQVPFHFFLLFLKFFYVCLCALILHEKSIYHHAI